MKFIKNNVTFVGGMLNGKVQQKLDAVKVVHHMIDGTDRKEVYKRCRNHLTKFIYEGNFERDVNQLRYP